MHAKLFAIPPRSCDLNPIENIFNLAKRDLKAQAIRKNLTYESFEQFSERVKCTLYGLSTVVIDNIIRSMDKRLKQRQAHKILGVPSFVSTEIFESSLKGK